MIKNETMQRIYAEGRKKKQQLRKVLIYVLAVPNLYNKNNESIIMYFINNTVIARSNFMKRIIPFHFCCSRIWQIPTEIINFLFYPHQIALREALHAFQYSRSKFNRKNH